MTTGINVRGVFNNVYDVEKLITNVTIKDAPFELSKAFLLQHNIMHGDVVENSLRRGKLKGTDIEIGARYLQMVNVQNALPYIVNFGRFQNQIFSDDKTECRSCKNVGHPFCRCPQKTEFPPEMCSRCKSTLHKTRECTNKRVCSYCSKIGP